MTLAPPLSRVLTALAGALFVALAATRRLNFDEALALRAGWLDLAGEPSAPAFLMPWTLFAGAVGHAVADPGTVLLLLRLAVSAGVAFAFVGAARAAGLAGWAVAGASWLALANAAFATHAIEFRYDAAVLLLLLAAFSLIARGGSPILVGVVAGLLATHHLKGAYFAAGVVATVIIVSRDRARDMARFGLGAILSLAAWVALLAPLGLLGRFGDSLRGFYELAAGSSRVPIAEAMGPVLRRDLAWWLFVLVALVGALVRKRRETPAQREPREVAAQLFALFGVGFWIVHPHAWAYLVALPVPFLLFAALPSFGLQRRRTRGSAVAVIVGVVLQVASAAPAPLGHIPAAFAAPWRAEVALLRALRASLKSNDRILDPSGVVYFARPCVEEWYVDALYSELVRQERWMRALAAGVPADCTLALNTYRLGALPSRARESLGHEFAPLASGLAVRRSRVIDGAISGLAGAGEIRNYW